MKTTPSQPAPAPAPGRRAQPVRQTRTNPARSSTRANGASRPSGDGPLEGQKRTKAPGFLPAITHFTDAITALPKEVVRHFGLLKEVDAKLYGPENTLRELTEAALNTPAPSTAANAFSSGDATASRPLPTGSSDVEPSSGALVATGDQAEWRRRELFFNLRVTLTEILVSLDEKNHVISTATQALQKQLARCESSYGSVGNEISDEARYGSLSHWAYAEKPGSRTNGSSNERPRREVANASSLAGLTSEEMVASRSESRREAMAARRSRLQPAEPAVQDSGPSRQRGAAPTPSVATATATATTTVTAAAPSKKGSAPAKSKKAAESAAPLVPSTNTASPSNHELHPNKRRRTEKAAASRAASGAAAAASPQLESSETGHGGARAVEGRSPRSTPAADGSKKRVRSGAAATTTANARRRTNNNNNNDGNDKSSAKPPTAINSSSSINNNKHDNNAAPAASPSLASSPVQPNFPAASKDNPGSSPLLQPTQQRPSTGRGRQDSGPAASADVASGGRRRPSSLTSNQLQAPNDASTAVHDEPGPTTAKTNVSESKSSAKAVAKPAKDLHLESKNEGGLGETSKGGDGGGGSPRRPGSAKTKENVSRATGETDDDDGLSKRGASAGVSNKNPTSINTGTAMPRGSSRSSKTSTPVNANFPEQLRSRSSRGGDGVSAAKRAPKKGGAASSVRHQPPSHSPPAESPRARGERGTSKTTATTRIKDDPLESAAPTGGEVTANREGEPGRADDDGDAEPAEAREDDEEAEVEEDEDDEGSSSLEPRYCYCNQVSYGSMVACDAKDCPREWFHLNCVGLTKPPGKNETWYCDECKAKLAAGKNTHQHQHPQQPPASSSNDTGLHSTSGNNAGSRSRGGSVRS